MSALCADALDAPGHVVELASSVHEPTADGAAAPASFGKIAARGDFWSSGEHGPAERALASWLTHSVEASGGTIPVGAVRFVARDADGPTLVGSWIASHDAVGRSFPLAVWCSVPRDVEGAQQSLLLAHYDSFAVAVERAFSARLTSELDELERARGALPAPHASALPALLQRARGELASTRVHTFAARSFARWPVESLGYAVAAVQRAAGLVDRELTLDVPVPSLSELFVWLELMFVSRVGSSKPSRILWSPSLRRMLVCLGSPSTQLLAYLNRPDHRSSRRWPLWTETRPSALWARAELGGETVRCLDDNGTLAELIELLRSRS